MRGYQLAHVTTIQAILSLVQNNHWKANEKHVIQSKKWRVWGEIIQRWKLTNIIHLSRNLLIPVTTFIAIKYYFAISFYFNKLQVQNFWCWSLAGFLKGAKAPQTTTFYSDPCKQRPQPTYAAIWWYCISHSNSSLNMFFPFFTTQ